MINKYNKKRVYISAELDVIEKKEVLPEQTNKIFFRERTNKTREKKISS